MLDPKGIEAACAATVLGEDECEKPVHLEPREAETAIRAYLSTVTPAEVGWMVDAQTEARAIVEEIVVAIPTIVGRERALLAKAIEVSVITALAAKNAELAAVHQQYVDANEARIDAEAQLADVRKALAAVEQFFRCIRFDRDRDLIAAEAFDAVRAARRALEAQGGENG